MPAPLRTTAGRAGAFPPGRRECPCPARAARGLGETGPAAQVQSVAMKMLATVSPPTAANAPLSTFSSSRFT